MKELFSAEEISVFYGEKQVLNRLSFSLSAGEVTGLLGKNGGGKTTLFRSICGQLPYEGRFLLEGKDLRSCSAKERAQRISYLPQRHGIAFSLPVVEVVLLGVSPWLSLFGQPTKAQRQAAMEALEQVGLAELSHRDFLTLSEGQKQLCLLARTMVQQAGFWLLDEPDAALDVENKQLLFRKVRQMVAAGQKAALMAIHDPQLALGCCDRLLFLKEGALAASIVPKTATEAEMTAAFRLLYPKARPFLRQGKWFLDWEEEQ